MQSQFYINGMHCTGCRDMLTAKLKAMAGVTSVKINLESRKAIVESNQPITLQAFAKTIANAGPRYTLSATAPSFFIVLTAQIKKFAPLIIAFGSVCVITAIRPLFFGSDPYRSMHDFMAAFFLIFGGLKVMSWNMFAQNFRAYDPLAARARWYAYAYPAIEIFLGLSYALYFSPEIIINALTVIILSSSTIGVIKALRNEQEIRCACLGGYFNIPISWFTVFENILMIVMAISMQLLFKKI